MFLLVILLEERVRWARFLHQHSHSLQDSAAGSRGISMRHLISKRCRIIITVPGSEGTVIESSSRELRCNVSKKAAVGAIEICKCRL